MACTEGDHIQGPNRNQKQQDAAASTYSGAQPRSCTQHTILSMSSINGCSPCSGERNRDLVLLAALEGGRLDDIQQGDMEDVEEPATALGENIAATQTQEDDESSASEGNTAEQRSSGETSTSSQPDASGDTFKTARATASLHAEALDATTELFLLMVMSWSCLPCSYNLLKVAAKSQ